MISGVFGLTGSGKSVLLAKAAAKALAGKPCIIGGNFLHDGDFDYVLTNFTCAGCYKLDPDTLGRVDYRRCLFLIDEISMISDSRAFKSFSDEYRFFWTQLIRKRDNAVIWCSQGWDSCDKKIRDVTDKYFYIRKAPILSDKLSIVAPIDAYMRVEDGQIKNGYELAPPIMHSLLWLPKYWDMFDTSETMNFKPLSVAHLQAWDGGKSAELDLSPLPPSP